jgi:predicted HAD superfamily phosphohydrolase YqeG
MNKEFLRWFQGTLIAWAKSDTDASHRQWIQEMFETFQRRIRGEF